MKIFIASSHWSGSMKHCKYWTITEIHHGYQGAGYVRAPGCHTSWTLCLWPPGSTTTHALSLPAVQAGWATVLGVVLYGNDIWFCRTSSFTQLDDEVDVGLDLLSSTGSETGWQHCWPCCLGLPGSICLYGPSRWSSIFLKELVPWNVIIATLN